MTRGSSGASSERRPPPASTFPRPVRRLAGRRADLDRILAHLDDEVLFLVYGVGGIGKSELVYQLMREVRALPAWREATAIHLDVRPGASTGRALARLLAAAGAPPEPRRGQATEQEHLTEQLAVLARLLDARPFLLFLDDVHHLPAGLVAEALAWLSRHVQRSRLFVASRRVIQLAPDAPPPVVTTLGPLDPAAAEQMMEDLAERMQVPRVDPARLMQATHGSPFHIRRLLARHTADDGSLDDWLGELSPAARRVLLVAAVAQRRPSLHDLRSALGTGEPLDEAVSELSQRFLVDMGQGRLSVHDLVREPLMGRAGPEELAAAHADAAAACLSRLRRREASVVEVVDAINHHMGARRWDAAWELVERWQSELGAAGLDHLLLEPLEELRRALPSRRIAVDLLVARCLVRASLIERADGVLARVGDDRSDAEDARYLALSGEIAQRRGELARAEELLERAWERAPDEAARFQVRLQTAVVAMFGGDGERARRILADALGEVRAPTVRQRGRCGWARAMSWIFDEQHELAAAEARRVRLELAGTGLDDLTNRLAMLETLAAIEHEDVEVARSAARALDDAGLRRRVASLYRALSAYADGEARGASAELLDAHEYLRGHGDTVNAYVAGYFGSAALAEIGRLGDAQALAERTADLARGAGLRGLLARSLAQRALLAAEAMQSPLAHRLADEALSSGCVGPRSRATAHCAHARAYTIEGDVTIALEHVALARQAVTGLDRALAAIRVEHAAVDLVAGRFDSAVERAESAAEQYRNRSRSYETARTQLVLAAAYIARGRRTDVLLAERTIGQARELADRAELRSVQVGCAILSAALERRGSGEGAAEELLADALCRLDPERGSIYASTLLAAIEGGAAAWVAPGAVALLAHLGFNGAVDCYLVDRRGRRAATERDVGRERAERDLVVDEVHSVIAARRGEVEIRSRPMQCALLSALIQARGEVVSPDALYKRVWGVAEYHPLRNRNALYVAINRLRKSLKAAFPDREVIESVAGGWRLADGVDACAAMPARDPSG